RRTRRRPQDRQGALCFAPRRPRPAGPGGRCGTDEMSWLPKSPKARRRLTLVAAIAPVLALAVGLALWGLRDSISFFYTPSQAAAAKPPPGRSIQLGGLVAKGSVVKHPDGGVEFTVQDQAAVDKVVFQGDLPDLFREGQGVVATGAFREDGVFE